MRSAAAYSCACIYYFFSYFQENFVKKERDWEEEYKHEALTVCTLLDILITGVRVFFRDNLF